MIRTEAGLLRHMRKSGKSKMNPKSQKISQFPENLKKVGENCEKKGLIIQKFYNLFWGIIDLKKFWKVAKNEFFPYFYL